MSIITISRGSYSHGREVAEKVARRLNYTCVSREILLQASEKFNIPEISLLRSIKNAPSFLDHFTHSNERYVSYVRMAILQYVAKDNVVYHGFAGHFLLEGIPHVLKVRICATMEDRARLIMGKEKVSRQEALKIIADIDNERRKWGMHFYEKNPCDLHLYDLGLVIDALSIDDTVNIIIFTAKLPAFQTTPESRRVIKNQYLAAQVALNVKDYYPEASVSIEDETITIHIEGSVILESSMTEDIKKIALKTPGVKNVHVHVTPFY